YDYVICGHIHQPKKEIRENRYGRTTYLNAGDWVENLTALEYSFKRWKIYHYNHDKLSPFLADEDLKEMDMDELIASITDRDDGLIGDVREGLLEPGQHEGLLGKQGLSQD